MARIETWHCPPTRSLSDAQREALDMWLLRHGIGTNLISDASISTASNGEQLLHVTVLATDSDGHRYIDYASNLAQTWPLTVRLQCPPPLAVPSFDDAVSWNDDE